jgi:hypothetical protein
MEVRDTPPALTLAALNMAGQGMVRKALRSLHLCFRHETYGNRFRDTHETFYFRSLNNEVVTKIMVCFKPLPNIHRVCVCIEGVAYLVDNLCSIRHFRKEPGQDKCSWSREDLATHYHAGQGTIPHWECLGQDGHSKSEEARGR